MNRTLSLFFLFCIVSTNLFAQNPPDSSINKLNQQLALHFRNNELSKAYPVAEEIVAIQRRLKNLPDLAGSIKNLAIVLSSYDKQLRKELRDSKTAQERRGEILGTKRRFYVTIPALFEEALDIYEKKLKARNLSLAEAKFQYAFYITRYQGEYPRRTYETKKVENLLKDAVEIRKDLLGKDDDLTLFSLITLANFYQDDAVFEKSIALYDIYIRDVNEKHGKKSMYLVPALRQLARFFVAIDNQTEARKIVDQITEITGMKEAFPAQKLDLSLRNKKDVEAKLVLNLPITKYLKKGKWLLVNVEIDEKGRVAKVNSENPNQKDIFKKDVKEKADKEVKKWKFKPFIYKGKPT